MPTSISMTTGSSESTAKDFIASNIGRYPNVV